MKTLHEILAERDDEYKYVIRSTTNIHDPKLFGLVKLALVAYKVRDFEKGKYEPFSKGDDFKDFPNSPLYEINVTTGYKMATNVAVQEIAMYTHINTSHLAVVRNGRDVEPEPIHTGRPDEKDPNYIKLTDPDFKPDPRGEVPSDAQEHVGIRRLGAFIKELQTDRKERLEDTTERQVYEGFVCTHTCLENTFLVGLRKGYYLVERFTNDTVRIDGPFGFKPDNYPFQDKLSLGSIEHKVLSESREGTRTIVEISIGQTPPFQPTVQQPQGGAFRVAVVDNNSGRNFDVIVRGVATEDVARRHALKIASKRHQLPIDTLSAKTAVPVEAGQIGND